MYEQATRLLGLEGLVVMALEERGAKSSSLTPLQLGAAGELAARAPARMPRGLSLDEAITAAATSWRRSSPTPTAAVYSTSSMAGPPSPWSATCARFPSLTAKRSSSSDRSLRRLPASGQGDPPERHGVCDPFHLVRGVNTALDTSGGSTNA
jgi:hypothetical protein